MIHILTYREKLGNFWAYSVNQERAASTRTNTCKKVDCLLDIATALVRGQHDSVCRLRTCASAAFSLVRGGEDQGSLDSMYETSHAASMTLFTQRKTRMTTSAMLVKQAVRGTLFQIVATGALALCQQVPPTHAPLSVQCPSLNQTATGGGQAISETQMHGRFASFEDFIWRVGREDEGIQEDIREARENVRERTNYEKVMHIRGDEEQVVHTTLVDAYYRLKRNRQLYFEKEQETGRDVRSATTCEEYWKVEALQENNRNDELKKRHAIVAEAIYHIYQNLGEEEFKKVERYVHYITGGTYAWTYPGPPEPPAVQP